MIRPNTQGRNPPVSKNVTSPEAQDWRRQIATEVAAIYARDPRVVAVTLGGSVARGSTDRYSDADIYCYCRDLPSTREFSAWARQAGGERCNCYGDADAVWGHYYFDDFMMDVKLMLVSALETLLDDVVDRFDTDESKQFTIGGILDCVPICGKPLVEKWQTKAAAYPLELARAKVRQHLWFGPHWYMLPMLRDRGEVLYIYEFFHRWTKNIVGILAALNRRYDRGELKGVAPFLDSLPVKPKDVARRLRSCYEIEAEVAIEEFHHIIEEVFNLVEEHMPEIDTREARRIFNHPPLASDDPPQRRYSEWRANDAKQEPIVVAGIDSNLKLAAKGDLSAVKKILVEKSSMLNAMNEGHHRTLLWEAANGNRMEVVRYLVEKGADVNIPGRYRSETLVLLKPYCIARKKKRKQIAEYLLKNGTEIDIYSAAFLGELEILKKHTEENENSANILHPDDSVWSIIPLHYAVAGGQTETANHLIQIKTNVSKHSELLLDMACRLGRMDLIHLLVDAGADPLKTPVFSVVYKSSPEIMAFFFGKGVDVDKKDNVTGWPPIAYVSRGDKGEHPEKVKSLIKYGADVNASGPKGVTALHAAAKAGFVSVIDALLNAGADVDAKMKSGETPLALARKHKRAAAEELLKENGATA